jgi:ABC-2 type transport system permease protein
LQVFVNHNPVTHLVAAVRGVMAGGWDANATMWTLIWGVLFTVVFGVLTMRLYNRK